MILVNVMKTIRKILFLELKYENNYFFYIVDDQWHCQHANNTNFCACPLGKLCL